MVVMITQLMGSVSATPKYPSHGTRSSTDRIFTTSSITEEASGTTFCPLPCRVQRRMNSGPSTGKKQTPVFTYMAAFSQIKVSSVDAIQLTMESAKRKEKRMMTAEVTVTIPTAVRTPCRTRSDFPAPMF